MSKNPSQISTLQVVLVGFIYIVIGIVLVIAFALAGLAPLIASVQLAQGINIFAIAYLDAQFIERIVDPFSVTGANNSAKNGGGAKNAKKDAGKNGDKAPDSWTPFGNWREIDRLEWEAAHVPPNKETLTQSELLNQLKSQRVIAIWGFSSLLGMILAYATFGLFQIVGITFVGGLMGHALDAIISGVIIGGGTKPLHDFIEFLQEPKTATKTS